MGIREPLRCCLSTHACLVVAAVVVGGAVVGAGCATVAPARKAAPRAQIHAPAPAPTPAANEPPVREPVPPPVEPAANDSTPPVEASDPPAPDSPSTKPNERGLASFYADLLSGNRTASGERYRPGAATCAHRTHPFGTKLRIKNVASGRSVVCRVNDRGPFVAGRVVDVSGALATELGMRKRGVIAVEVFVLP